LGDIAEDAVDAADFVDNAGVGAANGFVREPQIIGVIPSVKVTAGS
jgi:hypothetical protein